MQQRSPPWYEPPLADAQSAYEQATNRKLGSHFIAVNLSQQMVRHRVSTLFLVQAYLATILVFAGMYTVSYKLDVSTFIEFVQADTA